MNGHRMRVTFLNIVFCVVVFMIFGTNGLWFLAGWWLSFFGERFMALGREERS